MDKPEIHKKSLRGRPTIYRPIYCKKLVEFFERPPTKVVKRQIMTKMGMRTEDVEVPNDLPTIEGFARAMGISVRVLYEWIKIYPEFMHAFMETRSLGKEFLVQNGLKGFYQPHIFQFIAKNYTDMRDKTEMDMSAEVTINIVNYAAPPDTPVLENR